MKKTYLVPAIEIIDSVVSSTIIAISGDNGDGSYTVGGEAGVDKETGEANEAPFFNDIYEW